jgi:hypothetical protein
MNSVLFFGVMILIFTIFAIAPAVFAVLHTYFGGKQFREFREEFNPNALKPMPKTKVVFLLLTIDTAFIITLASVEIIIDFVMFILQLVILGFNFIVFFGSLVFMSALLFTISYMTLKDVIYNKINAIKYEVVSESDFKPDIDFDPIFRFKPLKFLISRNLSREGLLSFGVLLSKRRFIRSGKDRIEFEEYIILKNTKEDGGITVKSVNVLTGDVSLLKVSPELPIEIKKSSSASLRIRCSMRKDREIAPVEIRINVS